MIHNALKQSIFSEYMPRVGIIGVGWFGFQPETPAYSFREMTYKAANRAYMDAGGLDPRKDIDAFVSSQEDFWEGRGSSRVDLQACKLGTGRRFTTS
jgi:hypothetical protein